MYEFEHVCWNKLRQLFILSGIIIHIKNYIIRYILDGIINICFTLNESNGEMMNKKTTKQNVNNANCIFITYNRHYFPKKEIFTSMKLITASID